MVDFRKLNEPQPSPSKPTTEQKLMTSLQVRASARCIEMHCPEMAEFIDARRQMGVEKYGAELYEHNGRDPLIDALQEKGDFVVYLTQAIAEERPGEIRAVLQRMRSEAILDGEALIDIIKRREAGSCSGSAKK